MFKEKLRVCRHIDQELVETTVQLRKKISQTKGIMEEYI